MMNLWKASSLHVCFPVSLPLMSSKEKLKCRKIRSVLRYHVPNKHKFPEKYSHHLLFMYYPFRSEAELLDPDLYGKAFSARSSRYC